MSVSKWNKVYQLALMHQVVPSVYAGIQQCKNQFFLHLSEKQIKEWEKTNIEVGQTNKQEEENELLRADHLTNPLHKSVCVSPRHAEHIQRTDADLNQKYAAALDILEEDLHHAVGKGNQAKTAENRYKAKRREMGWSREAAAFELHMSDDKLERIENGKQLPTAKDVLDMSDAYNSPELCNYFCNKDCEIGRHYVPEVPDSELPDIILRLLSSVNDFSDMEKQLIRITADGIIDPDEIPDLVKVQHTLEQLSIMIEALQLRIEKKIDEGEIDESAYKAEFDKLGKLF